MAVAESLMQGSARSEGLRDTLARRAEAVLLDRWFRALG